MFCCDGERCLRRHGRIRGRSAGSLAPAPFCSTPTLFRPQSLGEPSPPKAIALNPRRAAPPAPHRPPARLVPAHRPPCSVCPRAPCLGAIRANLPVSSSPATLGPGAGPDRMAAVVRWAVPYLHWVRAAGRGGCGRHVMLRLVREEGAGAEGAGWAGEEGGSEGWEREAMAGWA
jgi:hypothetical protein